MVGPLRSIALVLSCSRVAGLSASIESKPKHHNEVVELIAEEGLQNDDAVTSLEERGRLIRQEAAEYGRRKYAEHHRSYATSSTARPEGSASLAEEEPHVSCGKHMATECSACVVSHGPDWCHGDCSWDEESTTCKRNAQTTEKTTTTDKYPAVDEAAMSNDEIADKLRAEQEASEQQRRADKGKFYATIGIAAGVSGLGIMICGLVAICCIMEPKKEEGKQIEEPLLNDEDAKDDQDAEEAAAEDNPQQEATAADDIPDF